MSTMMTWSLIHTDGTVATTGTLESVERYAQETIPRCEIDERGDGDYYCVYDEDGEIEARIEEVDDEPPTEPDNARPTVPNSDPPERTCPCCLPIPQAPRVPVECRWIA